MNLSIVCACLPVVYGLFKFKKPHPNAAQSSNKCSASTSLRRLFGNKSNPFYTDIEDPSSKGNHLCIASTSVQSPDKAYMQSHDTVPLQSVYVQKTFLVE